MRKAAGLFLLLTLVIAGCESKKEAAMQARQAYLAGQLAAAQQSGQRAPQVVVQGSVRNPVIPWTEDLTLAQAIVDADYTGFMNPILVRVVRNGQLVEELKGSDLLHGKDIPLQAGDIVVLIQ